MSCRDFQIAFVGTFPPTACGIATFTKSLRDAVVECAQSTRDAATQPRVSGEVIRLVDQPSDHLSKGVVGEWRRGDSASLLAAVEVADRYDCVILQHEFGIFGGTDGDEVVEFVRSCSVPVIVVLHTVLLAPTPRQRDIVDLLVGAADLAVVQSHAAYNRLLASQDVDPRSVTVIPHGAAANFGDPSPRHAKDEPFVLTWGLIGPGKGIEQAIRALGLLSRSGRDVPTYVVAGRTHPNVLRMEGESYRQQLKALAEDLGVGDHLILDASYRSWVSLRAMIRSATVVLLPYDNPDQVTSGVLVEAIASLRPVVATAFPHAVEILGNGAGIVVPHTDPAAIADALSEILGNDQCRLRMREAARVEAVPLLWPTVGQEYLTKVRLVAGSLVSV